MKTPRSNDRANWLPDVLAKIEALRKLQAGWDSYGAAPVHPKSIENACLLMTFLALSPKVGEPSVGASGDGYVGFSWDEGKWSLDVEVLPEGLQVACLYIYLAEHGCESKDGCMRDSRELLRFFS